MDVKKRTRSVYSISGELLEKSREAALAAVQIFNNPQITFKSEIFIVLMNISWTYLLHCYFRRQKIEYRYFKKSGKKRIFDRTAKGAYKYWELERCLSDSQSPVEVNASNNLRFLIGIRHEIEHQMTSRIDDSFSAKFQACCLNYNEHIKRLFGKDHGIDRYLTFSLQFSSISKDQFEILNTQVSLPANIQGFVQTFESSLTEGEFNSPKFAYRIFFVPKTANRKGQADEVIEFIKPDSEFAQNVNRKYALIKETEKRKLRPGKIVETMNSEGFENFNMYQHTNFWKHEDAKNPSKGLGIEVEGTWYWYEPWLDRVREYCRQLASN